MSDKATSFDVIPVLLSKLEVLTLATFFHITNQIEMN